jgi:hypothetical protein
MIPGLSSLLDPSPPEKAYLVAETSFSDKVEFQFNPDSLRIQRSVSWNAEKTKVPKAYKALAYGGSGYDSLSVRMILDTTIPSDIFGLRAAATQLALLVPGAQPGSIMDLLLKSSPDSVLDTVDQLVEWTYPAYEALPGTLADGEPGSLLRPPAVAFIWGDHIKFFGAIKDLSFNLTLFDDDGTPVRAEGTVTLVGRREGPTDSKLSKLYELFTDKGDKPKAGKTSTGEPSDAVGFSLF